MCPSAVALVSPPPPPPPPPLCPLQVAVRGLSAAGLVTLRGPGTALLACVVLELQGPANSPSCGGAQPRAGLESAGTAVLEDGRADTRKPRGISGCCSASFSSAAGLWGLPPNRPLRGHRPCEPLDLALNPTFTQRHGGLSGKGDPSKRRVGTPGPDYTTWPPRPSQIVLARFMPSKSKQQAARRGGSGFDGTARVFVEQAPVCA